MACAEASAPLGKRKSNKPKAFQPTYGTFSKNGSAAVIEQPIGDGDVFQSIPVIRQRLRAINADAAELKLLHKVVFGNEGDTDTRKDMLLNFKGLSGKSSASTDAMRVRAFKVLSEAGTKKLIPALIRILGLVEIGVVGRNISQMVAFLCKPSRKTCIAVDVEPSASAEPSSRSQPDDQMAAEQAASKTASRKNAKNAREHASEPDEEPSLKRPRGARGGKQKPAAKHPAAKKPSKRKAAEVEVEGAPEADEVGEENDAPREEPCDAAACNDQPDVSMQDGQEEGQSHKNDEEPPLSVGLHPEPPVVGRPEVQQGVPVGAGQKTQKASCGAADSQCEDGEEPEPPPPGLEIVSNQAEHVQAAAVHPPVVPAAQRPPIGSQASPCDGGHAVSHDRSQPPQLGVHALQPPLELERVATSDVQPGLSHDNGSVTKAGRARGNSKRIGHLGVAAPAGTSKKAAPGGKRGAQAVAALNTLQPGAQQLGRSQVKGPQTSDLKKLYQQAEKHQKALVAMQDTMKRLVEGNSALLDSLRKLNGASS